MDREVIIIGAGGHGKVVADIIAKSNDKVIGFLDDSNSIDRILTYPVLGKASDCNKYQDKEFFLAIGNNETRKRIATEYPMLKFYTAIHPSAIISENVNISEGACVMAGAVINSSAEIGKHCIINTSSVIEHDDIISDFVHISPGAVLCGTVIVGECTHIGAGATVKNNVKIAPNVVVGAGATVVDDITEMGIYCGVPARKLK